jgi:FADH2 O2-dependent halogenase
MTQASTERLRVDIAVVGSGFAGTITALALRRRGHTVAIVEQGHHPRFAIGESSTPLANLLLEEIADQYDLPAVRAFSKWGTWRRAHPTVGVGLKRGFTFLFHEPGLPFTSNAHHDRELMVAASPHDDVADTHWYRPDFDMALVAMAEEAGVVYFDDTTLDSFVDDGRSVRLDGIRRGAAVSIDASFVVDASGPRGCLYRLLSLGDAPSRYLPATTGIFTHFADVARWDALHTPEGVPPFPPDDAALHHIFPGGWIWVLRFNNGLTSAGAALSAPALAALTGSDGAEKWAHLMAQFPAIGAQFAHARAVRPFVELRRLAFRSRMVCGSRWALLPSAVGIVDPLLSTGFPLTLLGIQRLLAVLESTVPGAERDQRLAAYAQITLDELDATEQLVGALYATMDDPALFKRLTLLYFAAASYSETVRRLGRPERAQGFLLQSHPQFGPRLRACAAAAAARPAGTARARLLDWIDRAIEPFDTAGLRDRQRRDWYQVRAEDLLEGAPKLGATIAEVRALLERCGIVAPAGTGRGRVRSSHRHQQAGRPIA